MTLSENIWNNRIGGFVLYAKSTVDGSIVAVKVNPVTGALQVDTEVTVALDPTGLATGAKQDTGNASLDSIDDKLVAVADSSTPYIVLCGKQSDGAITPIQVDATGQIIIEGT